MRYTYDNNYFNDLYQGIPIGGYNVLIDKLFAGCEIQHGLWTTWRTGRRWRTRWAKRWSTPECWTPTLTAAAVSWSTGVCASRRKLLDEENHQGVAVVNYTDRETPYTRVIEHKHFEFGTQPKTVITREYPADWTAGMEPYYPVNDAKNQELFEKYRALAAKEENVIFGGRLAEYKYYDMDKVIESAMNAAAKEFGDA